MNNLKSDDFSVTSFHILEHTVHKLFEHDLLCVTLQKLMSAYYVCCIYSNAFQTTDMVGAV